MTESGVTMLGLVDIPSKMYELEMSRPSINIETIPLSQISMRLYLSRHGGIFRESELRKDDILQLL